MKIPVTVSIEQTILQKIELTAKAYGVTLNKQIADDITKLYTPDKTPNKKEKKNDSTK